MVPASLKRRLALVEARELTRSKQAKNTSAVRKSNTTKRKVNKRTTKRKAVRSTSKARTTTARSTETSKRSTAGRPANTARTSTSSPSQTTRHSTVAKSQLNHRCKVEASPNARAKCRVCEQIIEKGEHRVGVASEWSSVSPSAAPIYRYYHLRCCPQHIRKIMPTFSHITPQEQQKLLRNMIGIHRTHLTNELIENWGLIASDGISNLVIALPRNKSELYRILGSDQSSFPYRGQELQLLHVIRRFVDEQGYQAPTPSTETRNEQWSDRLPARSNSSRRRNEPVEIIEIDDSDEDDGSINDTGAAAAEAAQALANLRGPEGTDKSGDDDDDEIAVGETLTCAQVIQQRFDRAAANGEVVAID
mmetsp:Transcript_27737/g.65152  ORF Transcript_27737/g.65152 Transcript_27737/m.65152 type:complete len:363 (-) Transcript_27737:609-1697(-)